MYIYETKVNMLSFCSHFFLIAYFNDIAVGAVCCRVDHSQNQKRLYIMTLGCLAPYRRLGIGKALANIQWPLFDS